VKKYSIPAFITIAVFALCLRFLMPMGRTLTWDVFGYYMYLPGIFIYGDLVQLDWLQEIFRQYQPSGTLYQINTLPGGIYGLRYSCGEAILNLPFFFLAHLIAFLGGFAQDGFTYPYQACYSFGTLFYSLCGFFILRKILLQWFDEKNTAITLLSIYFGTNLLQMMCNGALTHPFIFFLVNLLIWLTIQWHNFPNYKNSFLLGLCLGLICITRPPEFLYGLIPLLWGVYNKETLKNKILFFRTHIKFIIIAAFGFLLALLPQVLYWKICLGFWIYDSYQNSAVGFNFLHPSLISFLFSVRGGWWIYTPLMAVAAFGFYILYKKNKPIFWPLFLHFIFNLYLLSSWSEWWYGGSLGQRSVISGYAYMAIPLGFLFMNQRKKWLYFLLPIFISLNIFQTWQFYFGFFPMERMTKEYFFRNYFSTTYYPEDNKLLLVQRPTETIENIPDSIRFSKEIFYSNNFETFDSAFLCTDSFAFSGKHALVMDSTHVFTKKIVYTHRSIVGTNEYVWLRFKYRYYVTDSSITEPPLLVCHYVHEGKMYKYRTSAVPTFKIKNWQEVHLDYITLEPRMPEDEIVFYFWYRDKKPSYVDDLVVERYIPEK
jgi:hypothetical protein